MFRMVSVPKMSSGSLDQFIYHEFDQCFSFDLTDYLIDYRMIRRFKTLGQERISILLAAVPRSDVENVNKLWKEAGIQPQTIDLGLDCIIRLFKVLFEREAKINSQALISEEGHSPDHIVIVDFRHDKADFIVLAEGQLDHYSSVAVHLPQISKTAEETAAAACPKEPDTPPEGSAEYAFRGMIPKGNLQIKRKRQEHEFILEELFIPYFPSAQQYESAFTAVIEELSAALNTFRTNHGGQQIKKVYLLGEYADFPGFQGLIHKELQVSTVLGYPGKWKPEFREPSLLWEKDWLSFTGLCGLALRGMK